MAKNVEVTRKVIDAAISLAAETAQTKPQEGVESIIDLLNKANADKDASEYQYVIDKAKEAGFDVEFWPTVEGMRLRVRWENA